MADVGSQANVSGTSSTMKYVPSPDRRLMESTLRVIYCMILRIVREIVIPTSNLAYQTSSHFNANAVRKQLENLKMLFIT